MDRVTTLCHAWLVRRADGAVLGFTDHDRPLSVDGVLCEPAAGMVAAEARASAGLALDSTEIAGALSSARLVDGDIAAGAYDGATVEALSLDWTRPEAARRLRRWRIGRLTRRDHLFVAELDAIGLDQPRGRLVHRACDAELGDRRCRVDLAAARWRGDATVVTASGALVTLAGLEGFADGFFSHGHLFGAAGRRRIDGHAADGTLARLRLSPDGPLFAPGDRVSAVAGCDQRFGTCRDKFANELNFQGFPHLPGNDAAYRLAREGEPFDGAPLVP